MDFGEKETFRGLNRATQSQRQTGSAIKPLAVLVPGINEKIFTGATIYDDEKKTFEDGYAPGNNSGYLGKITVRRALESSQNVPFVEMMEEITPKKSISYLEKMGITSLTENDEGLPLALGGLDNGITPLEMAAAYATIANDGIYIEPTFYSSIVDNTGKTVLKKKQEKRTVFSEQVAYVLKKLLQEPVDGNNGTATYCSISGIDVAAKTGTTDDNYDKWLCGFTPYYTAVTWFGFDQNETIYYNNQNPAGIMWANVMRSIHDGFTGARFYQPNKISVEEICSDTGEIARSGCTNTYVEYFLEGTEPEECTQHSGSRVNAHIDTDEETSVYVDNKEDLELDPDDEEDIRTDNVEHITTQNEVIENTEDTENIVNDEIPEDVTDPENDIYEPSTGGEDNTENESSNNETSNEETVDNVEDTENTEGITEESPAA